MNDHDIIAPVFTTTTGPRTHLFFAKFYTYPTTSLRAGGPPHSNATYPQLDSKTISHSIHLVPVIEFDCTTRTRRGRTQAKDYGGQTPTHASGDSSSAPQTSHKHIQSDAHSRQSPPPPPPPLPLLLQLSWFPSKKGRGQRREGHSR